MKTSSVLADTPALVTLKLAFSATDGIVLLK